ncbi:oligosaccharide flippase family protein [Jiulongibacter sp. NS-SX5]|uniref:oligosaccharide flippase family protein n=1 Tax=Jiulongibacter sp. NS-SX5 TaxID=3463854 RepID=UPI004058191E
MSVIKRQTILGTIYAYGGVAIGTITQGFIIPNYLSTEENGLLALLLSWVLIMSFVVNLGFTSAGTRYFDLFRNNSKNHNGFLFNGFIFIVIGSILAGIILYTFKHQITSSAKEQSSLFKDYFDLILPLTIITAFFNLFDNYAKGLYDTVTGNFLSQFLQRFLVLVAIILYVTKLLNRDLFVAFWACAIALPSLFMFLHVIRLGNFSIKPTSFFWDSDFKSKFASFAGFSIVTGLSSIVITKLDTLMVYDYLGLGKTGIYNTCLFFGSVMTMSYNISIKASSAIVINAIENNDLKKVEQIFKKSSTTQLIFGTILLMLVWINIDTLFLFIKEEYSIGKTVLIIIGLAKLYDLASGINSLILGYSKYYKYDSFLVISFVGLLFVLNHFLIPQYGLNGAAIAAFIATLYYNSMRNYFIWRFFRIHPFRISSLYIIIIGGVGVLLGMQLPDLNQSIYLLILSLAYKSALIGGSFILIIYLLNISEEINVTINKGLKKLLPFLKNKNSAS